MRTYWALAQLWLATCAGYLLVWAFADRSPEWAEAPLATPAPIDLTSLRLSRFGLTALAVIETPEEREAARAAEEARLAALAAAALEGRVAPPFEGLAIPWAAVELAQQAQPMLLEPQQDAGGAWIIGYGRALAERPEAISAEEAEQMLIEDLQRAAQAVQAAVRVPLNGNELGALSELARSVGRESFGQTLVVALLNSGDREAAADAFRLYNKTSIDGALVESPALSAQRERTRELFLTPPT